IFSSMLPLPPRSPPFPYTTLFRSLLLFVDFLARPRQQPLVLLARLGEQRGALLLCDGLRLVEDLLRLALRRGQEPLVLLQQGSRSEEHTSELQSLAYLVCRLLLEK